MHTLVAINAQNHDVAAVVSFTTAATVAFLVHLRREQVRRRQARRSIRLDERAGYEMISLDNHRE